MPEKEGFRKNEISLVWRIYKTYETVGHFKRVKKVYDFIKQMTVLGYNLLQFLTSSKDLGLSIFVIKKKKIFFLGGPPQDERERKE